MRPWNAAGGSQGRLGKVLLGWETDFKCEFGLGMLLGSGALTVG